MDPTQFYIYRPQYDQIVIRAADETWGCRSAIKQENGFSPSLWNSSRVFNLSKLLVCKS